MSSSNNSSCPVLWPWPQSVPCSGHGVCVDSKCVCEVGYTGIGDFATIEGADCDIDELAIKVLWGIALVPTLVNAGFSARYLWLKRGVMAASELQRSWFDTINLLPAFGLFFSLLMIVFIGFKIYSPELAAIGTSLPVTVIFGFIFKTFWSIQALYGYTFLKITAAQARMKSEKFRDKVRNQLSIMQRFLSLMFFTDFIWGFSPLILVWVPSAWYAIGAIHYIGASLNLTYIGFVVFPRTLTPVRDDIRDALKTQGFDSNAAVRDSSNLGTYEDRKEARNEAMHEAEMKLTEAYKFVLNNAVQQLAIACVVGLWPFLLRKASYQLPITWAIAQASVSYEVYSISNFGKPQGSNVTKPTDAQNKEDESQSGLKNSQVHAAENVGAVSSSFRMSGIPNVAN